MGWATNENPSMSPQWTSLITSTPAGGGAIPRTFYNRACSDQYPDRWVRKKCLTWGYKILHTYMYMYIFMIDMSRVRVAQGLGWGTLPRFYILAYYTYLSRFTLSVWDSHFFLPKLALTRGSKMISGALVKTILIYLHVQSSINYLSFVFVNSTEQNCSVFVNTVLGLLEDIICLPHM